MICFRLNHTAASTVQVRKANETRQLTVGYEHLVPNISALHDLSGLGWGLRLRRLGCDAIRQANSRLILGSNGRKQTSKIASSLHLRHQEPLVTATGTTSQETHALSALCPNSCFTIESAVRACRRIATSWPCHRGVVCGTR